MLTVLEIILLLLGRLPLFDAVCTAFGTAGTGGFGIRSDSIAGYSPYVQVVVTIFMMLFGTNFAFLLSDYSKKAEGCLLHGRSEAFTLEFLRPPLF